MAVKIYIPLLNPIRLIQTGHKYQKLFSDAIPAHEEAACYFQPFNNLDTVKFQISSAEMLSDRNAVIVDMNNNTIAGIPATANYTVGGMFYVEFSTMFTGIAEGFYQVKVEIGDPLEIVLLSEIIHIAPTHPNTLLIAYTHDLNEFGVIFRATENYEPTPFYFRIPGGFSSDGFNPENDSEAYINDDYNVVQLESKPFFTQKLKIGNGAGVPWWVADKINRIFSCSNVAFFGRQWCKSEKGKLEANRSELYPMSGWTIDVIPAINSHADSAGGGDYNNDFNNDFNNS